MTKIAFIALACLACLLALGDNAFAWGAGVHLVTGNFILDHLSLLAPAVAEVLRGRRNDFLYGCLSADIFIGKGSKVTPDHCHNWSTGQKLLRASEPRLRAYAWGYLAHLAADVVAHNYYVPNMLGGLPGAGRLSHVWAEMQADAKVGCCWRQARAVFDLGRGEQDRYLRATLAQTKLSFGIKKRLFRGGLSLCGLKPWHDSVRFLDRRLPALSCAADDAYLASMLELTLAVTLDFLKDPEGSPATAFDPIGSQRLALAQRLRREETGLLFPIDQPLADLLASAA